MSQPFLSIRASSLSGYSDCPRRWAAQHIRGLVETAGYELRTIMQNIGASIGSGLHAAAALTLETKLEQGKLAPMHALEAAGIDEMRNRTADGVLYDREAPDMNSAEQALRRMIQVYQMQVAPSVQPILIEQQLEAEVQPGLVLTGKPDIVAREPGKVRDTKGGKRASSHAPQGGAYSLLARSRPEPIDITSVQIDWIQRSSLKKPQADAVSIVLDVARCESAAVNVLLEIDRAVDVFENGAPALRLMAGDPWAFLSNPSSMLCSPKWCAAWGTDFCRDHAPAKEETE